jgi:DNA-binding GntR family transcriptional regulator
MPRTTPNRRSRGRAAATGRSLPPRGAPAAEDSFGVAAYKKLKTQIVTLAIAPGAVQSEAMLERRLQCGRAAVRFAIARLHAERLVHVVPRGGTVVAELAISDIAQAYQVRTYLEILAARLCAQRCGWEDLERIGGALALARRAAEAGEPLPLLRQVHALYAAIHEAVQNDVLVEFVRVVAAITERFEYFCVLELGRSAPTLDLHAALFEAIRSHDPRAVEAAMAPIGAFRAGIMNDLLGVSLRVRSR